MQLRSSLSIIVLSFALTACGGDGEVPTNDRPIGMVPPTSPPVAASPLNFNEFAIAQGLQFSSEFSTGFTGDPSNYAGGAAAGDVDGDGDIDLFITRGDTQANLLFINDAGRFTNQATATLAFPNAGATNYKLSGPTFADIDGDKDLDLFIGGMAGDPSLIFANNGSGEFVNVTTGSGIDSMTSENTVSAAFGDYDKDGDLDLAVAHWGTARDVNNPGETETLWRNDSDTSGIKFTPVSVASGIADALALDLSGVLTGGRDYSFAPNFADINNDTYPDLLHVSDFKGSKVFINNQDGTFSDVTDTNEITDSNGMGAAVGDYDNDGDLDWFVSSINGNRLYNNNNGSLINSTQTADIALGGWGWGSCFADFDLNGRLDIYQTNGWIDGQHVNDTTKLWMSDGNSFTDQANTTGIQDDQQGRAVVCADFDNDRDIDVLLLLSKASQAALLWNNEINVKNSLSVFLQGPSPNTQAIGARIFVTTGSVTQMREVAIGSNFTSHNPTKQIFGLGDATVIDELKIIWPDGSETIQTNVAGNQDLVFTHPGF